AARCSLHTYSKDLLSHLAPGNFDCGFWDNTGAFTLSVNASRPSLPSKMTLAFLMTRRPASLAIRPPAKQSPGKGARSPKSVPVRLHSAGQRGAIMLSIANVWGGPPTSEDLRGR